MDAKYYVLGQTTPALSVSQLPFFNLWTALKAELADYYGAASDGFGIVEASWDGDEEYAEVVTLEGRIVGALDRPLTQEDVAAIWGVNRMEKRAFTNRIRSLYNIDSDLLPELTREQQSDFLADPVRYFLDADEAQSDAIMREIEARQSTAARVAPPTAQKVTEARAESNEPAAAKAARRKKPTARIDGQRELLLPITGGAGASKAQTVDAGKATAQTGTAGSRKTG
jgi:hypothetical protein